MQAAENFWMPVGVNLRTQGGFIYYYLVNGIDSLRLPKGPGSFMSGY